MKQRSTNSLLVFFLLVFTGITLPHLLFGQRSVEIGPSAGIAYYNGEFNKGMPFVNPKPAFGLLGRYNYDNRWAIKLSLNHGTIGGVDSIGNNNLNFNTTINEVSLTGEFNFWNYFTGSEREVFTPYLMAGAGVFLYNSKLSGFNNYVSTHKNNSFALIFGLGFKYSLTKRLGLGIEWGMRRTFSDCLDGVGTYFCDKDIPSVDHDIQVGNNFTDWYNFTLLSLTYKINLDNGMSCKNLKW
ncbi:MAG: outer membrane beta-barrel protein [Bacteroidales bacterium]|nr:outer membrane beta-barrel protein [Bacteroidales bacterium]